MVNLTDLYLMIKEEREILSNKFIIYCDLDGVLVDFDKGYFDLTGKETHHVDVQDDNVFWRVFRQSLRDKNLPEEEYWARLEWMDDGKQLWDYIKKYTPYVLTAPSVNVNLPFEDRYKMKNNPSMRGKWRWVKRNLRNLKQIKYKSAKRKSDLSGENKILIDDREDTIRRWELMGGIGIHHTSTDDTIKQLQKLGL